MGFLMQYMPSYGLNNGLSDTSSLSPWLCLASACAELTITAMGADPRCILPPATPIPIDPVLIRRYQQLFRFYDVQGDGRLSVENDHRQAAEAIAARWQGRRTPFPRLLELLLSTYQHETERRDLDHSGDVDEQEFIHSHEPVIAAFAAMRQQAEVFIDRSAGGFFDCLDLDGDGVLELADVEAYAVAYGRPTAGIRANLARMLAAFSLPPDRLPRAVFLTLVAQYWFDPSPDAPGRWLFCLDVDAEVP
jgi:hypothetical protein